MREGGAAVATAAIYVSDRPPDMAVDGGGYYQLEGTGSGRELINRGVGIAAGDTALDVRLLLSHSGSFWFLLESFRFLLRPSEAF